MVFGAVANPSFGVDGSIEMIVEIGTLGHAAEKGTQFQGIRARCFKCVRGALLACRLLGRGQGRDGLPKARGRKYEKQGWDNAPSDVSRQPK
jgi:hypothetical protein